MSEQKCRKVYVPVNLDVDAEVNILSLIHILSDFMRTDCPLHCRTL